MRQLRGSLASCRCRLLPPPLVSHWQERRRLPWPATLMPTAKGLEREQATLLGRRHRSPPPCRVNRKEESFAAPFVSRFLPFVDAHALFNFLEFPRKEKEKEHYGTFMCNNNMCQTCSSSGTSPRSAKSMFIRTCSQCVRKTNAPPKAVTVHGAEYAMGNTEELLKHRNFGTHERGARSAGDFNHSTQEMGALGG
jgi:hypothetical protein